MPRQRKDHQQTVGLLMQFWELPYVVHFIRVFKKLLKIKKNFTTESLAKELATDRLKHDFEEEIVKLVAFVSNEDDCDVHNWESIAEELLEKSGIKFDALKDSTFTELKPEERLTLIKYLVDLVRREKQDELLSFQAKNRKSKNLKFQPVGKDKEGNRYWYFDDKKLYRETCRGGITTLNTVCGTLIEWENLISGMKKSTSKIDREFSKFLKESVLPKVKPQLGESADSEKEFHDKIIPPKKMKNDLKEKKLKEKSLDDTSNAHLMSFDALSSEKCVVKKKKKVGMDSIVSDQAESKPKAKKFKKIKHKDKNIFIRKASSPVISPAISPAISPVHSPTPSPEPSPVRSPEKSPASSNDGHMEEDWRIDQKLSERSSGDECGSPASRHHPIPDDDPGIDLSIFEPRGKRKCVIEQEERRGKNKDWWEGQDEIDNTSDENRAEDDEGSEGSDTSPIKKKRRKKNKPIKSLERIDAPPEPEPEPEILPANKLYVFSTALANKGAYLVQQSRFTSIIDFHRSQTWDTPYLQFQTHCRPFKPSPARGEAAIPSKSPKLSQKKEPKAIIFKESKLTKEKKGKDKNRLTSPNTLISDDAKIDFASKFKKVLSQKKDESKKGDRSFPNSPAKKAPIRVIDHAQNSLSTDTKISTGSDPLPKFDFSRGKGAPIERDRLEPTDPYDRRKIGEDDFNTGKDRKKPTEEKLEMKPLIRDGMANNSPWHQIVNQERTPGSVFADIKSLNSNSRTGSIVEEATSEERQSNIATENKPLCTDPANEKVQNTSLDKREASLSPLNRSFRNADDGNSASFGDSKSPPRSSYPADVRKRPTYPEGTVLSRTSHSIDDAHDNGEVKAPPMKIQGKESPSTEKMTHEGVLSSIQGSEKDAEDKESPKGRESPKSVDAKQRFVDLTQSIRPDNLSYLASASNGSCRGFPAWKERERVEVSKDSSRSSPGQPLDGDIAMISSRMGLPPHPGVPFVTQSVLHRSVPELKNSRKNLSHSPRPNEIPISSSCDKYGKPLNSEAPRSEVTTAIAHSVLIPSSLANMEDSSSPKGGTKRDTRSPLFGAGENKKEKRVDYDARKISHPNTCKIDLTKGDLNEDNELLSGDPTRSLLKKSNPERPSLFPCAQKGLGPADKLPHYYIPALNQRSSVPPSVTESMLLKQLHPEPESRLVSPGGKVLESPLAHALPRGNRVGKESPLFTGHQKPPAPSGLSGAHASRHLQGDKDLLEKVGSPLLRHDPYSSPFQAQKDAAEIFSGSRSICTSKGGSIPPLGISPFPLKDGDAPVKYIKRTASPHLTHDPLSNLFPNQRGPAAGAARPSSPASSRGPVALHQQPHARRETSSFHGAVPGGMSPPLQHSHLPGPYYATRESLICQGTKSSCRSPVTGGALFGRDGVSNPNSSLSRNTAVTSDLESNHSSLSRDGSRNLSRSPPLTGVHNHFSSPFMHRETVLSSGQLFARPPSLSHQSLKSPVDIGQPARKSFSVESLTGGSERSEHGSIPFANGQSPTGLPFHPRLQGHSSHLGPHGHRFLSGYSGLLHGPNVGDRFPYPPNMHTAFSARTSFHPYIRSISDYTNR